MGAETQEKEHWDLDLMPFKMLGEKEREGERQRQRQKERI